MSDYHKVCEDCTLNHNGCLFQENDDAEDCHDVERAMAREAEQQEQSRREDMIREDRK